MFKLISEEEELLLQNTIKVCLIEPKLGNNHHHIYFYPVIDFNEGMIVFRCHHILTYNSLMLDMIELYEPLPNLNDIDEQVLYSLIPFLIKAAVEWAKLNKKNVTILKSNLPHFADHLIDQGFTLHNRINRNLQGLILSPIVKGVKKI
jgi:hypothetical protein